MKTKTTSTVNRILTISLWISLLFALSGCLTKPPTQPTSLPATATPASTEGQGEAETLIQLAKKELAQRMDLEVAEITVQSVEEKVFPDASLGVPEPGKSYAQVQTPGFIIILKAEGESYTYHGAQSRVVPVPEEETVTIYFNNNELNPEAECDQVFPVTRDVSPQKNPLQAALNELFQGPTPSEAEEGYTSFFTEETGDILLGAKVEGTTAYLNLRDIRSIIPGVSSSCGSQEFFAEVENTIKSQAPNVEKVLYAIEGNPEPFYEWVQMGCQEFNDDCDPEPFQEMNP